MPDPFGVTALAIGILDHAVKIVNFVIEWAQKTRAFGEDVRSMRTRLTTESSQLQTMTSFLREQVGNATRFDAFPEVQRQAIFGMIQEIEVLFASYSEIVAKYKIEELQQGYEAKKKLDISKLSLWPLAKASKEEAKKMYKEASFTKVAAWGLLEKKKVDQLLTSLENWNNKLLRFVICGLTFGIPAEPIEPDDETA